MSNLQLLRFVNQQRPELLEPVVTNLPSDVLGPELSEILRQSLVVDNITQYMNPNNYPMASKRWRPTAGRDTLPYCALQKKDIKYLADRWADLATTDVMTRYLNLNCLETNIIEGSFQFTPSATTKLIQVGFYNQMGLIEVGDPVEGQVRDRDTAIEILKDTDATLKLVFDLINPNSTFQLTPQKILKLHSVLMKSQRVSCQTNERGSSRLVYCNIGVTRRVSRVNVTIKRKGGNVQFCPFEGVDAEVQAFCDRLNTELMPDVQNGNTDPFAAAAWISHVFVSIHPFEDGNGRLSRMLSSIPLLMKRLPPLCVPSEHKSRYAIALQNVHSNRDGDYSILMNELFRATLTSLESLNNLATV
ncbi:hypothetical protein CVT25_006162 [Psilocybe cyanescens]|uniref:Fido domain-containing protein n=1 Tax=Psilocybe cyanescens TaxID=93625 RepID=A0A409X772_PSICY|nr:hypothetical protein CVT25_006162 [Psilocybe cyanescens]